MQHCHHSFIFLKYLDNGSFTSSVPEPGSTNMTMYTPAPMVAVVVCPHCGQVRHVDENGGITIVNESGNVTTQKHE